MFKERRIKVTLLLVSLMSSFGINMFQPAQAMDQQTVANVLMGASVALGGPQYPPSYGPQYAPQYVPVPQYVVPVPQYPNDYYYHLAQQQRAAREQEFMAQRMQQERIHQHMEHQYISDRMAENHLRERNFNDNDRGWHNRQF